MSTVSVQPIDIKDFILKRQQNEALIVLDTRQAASFLEGFIPGAIFLGPLDTIEQLALHILPKNEEIVVLAEDGQEQDNVERLSKAGIQNIIGYLAGGFAAWKENSWANDLVIEIEPDELMMDLPFDEKLIVIDVRNAEAFDADHLEGAESLPLATLPDPGAMSMIEEEHNVYLISQTGYKSLVAASLLKRQGLHNVRIVQGGWDALKKLVNP